MNDENGAIQTVLNLHRAGRRVYSWSTSAETWWDICPHCKGSPGVHDCGCWQDEQIEHECKECRTAWPCPTVQAIQEALS